MYSVSYNSRHSEFKKIKTIDEESLSTLKLVSCF